MYDSWRSHRPMLFCYGILINGIVQQKTMKILPLFIHSYEYIVSQTCVLLFLPGNRTFCDITKMYFCRNLPEPIAYATKFIVIWNVPKNYNNHKCILKRSQRRIVHYTSWCRTVFVRSVLLTNLFYGWRRHVISKSCNKASHTFMMH